MFLSRVSLDLTRMPSGMWQKWQSAHSYASHQWLWQLFADQSERKFLFRHESTPQGAHFYLLSEVAPVAEDSLFSISSKPFMPQLVDGMTLTFALRANPVVTRNGKRSDVLMDAKYQAKLQGTDPSEFAARQNEAAFAWLKAQGERGGFAVEPQDVQVVGQQRQRFTRKSGERPITFTTVDFAGCLKVTDAPLFMQTLRNGLGKSKAMGCGLMLIRRG
ncbi:type I-E CRISPR-associated protein Cas6/Cse3/CasE [Buttiauxella selenatireducens]|uniref:Type I-E CRISPR-associated protein Cas6/Cse3/CasE n=1 Tax=Buttiauxella selenatireducens TaxID=3073902 RepID=A0ABY9SCK3_9ENTR|nr:type I-E CRISPR-associated protein Cas6/Cse3/CasE [Buttiauxella sp. R73]WMY75235.1 type I-E CRISPR-associated protein Cas6/Cse3/CasE [Buttiauxella sp. R73]